MKSLMNKSKSKNKTEENDNEDVDNVNSVKVDKPIKKKKTPQNRVLFMVKVGLFKYFIVKLNKVNIL